eukprot:COSAG01_NODE_1312_length_10767_cov_25.248969_5_plen_70_part_00
MLKLQSGSLYCSPKLDSVENALIEELYGLKGLEFCQNPTSCFILLCVYYISVIRQICWIAPPGYVSNRI